MAVMQVVVMGPKGAVMQTVGHHSHQWSPEIHQTWANKSCTLSWIWKYLLSGITEPVLYWFFTERFSRQIIFLDLPLIEIVLYSLLEIKIV